MTNLNKIRDKELISHELLSAILGYKAWQMTGKGINWLLNIRDNDIVYERTGENQYVIDADHLSKLCKEWAFNKSLITLKSYTIGTSGICEVIPRNSNIIEPFNADTELEAIFKACEWILNHKGVLCLQL